MLPLPRLRSRATRASLPGRVPRCFATDKDIERSCSCLGTVVIQELLHGDGALADRVLNRAMVG
jgi:hypothetical protein